MVPFFLFWNIYSVWGVSYLVIIRIISMNYLYFLSIANKKKQIILVFNYEINTIRMFASFDQIQKG